jgi:hypothetical protein
MSTRDLIDAIDSGDAVGIETAFNSVMVDKVAERLDAMRTDMSQNMFRTPEETTDVDTEDTEEITTEE